jgi:hypothetical protein
MNSIIYIGFMAFLWVVNLFNGTGLGAAYRTTEYARIIMVFLAFLILMEKIRKEYGCFVQRRYFYELLSLFLVFVVVSYSKGQGWMAIDYLWVFLIVFILSNARPATSVLRWVALLYGALGFSILVIYNYTDVLKGWNPNSIAMIGLFSYLIFIIPFYGARDFRSFLMLALVGLAYTFLLRPTDSRSCMIAIVFVLLLSFRIISIERLLQSPSGLLIALLVPLIVACLVASLSGSGIIEEWNRWSMAEFGKPIFNGRDTTWLAGLRQMKENVLFGSGYISSGIWHNSAMACLTAYGVIGYGLWIKLFHMILGDSAPYTGDICIAGGMSVFMVLYWQQSVELGLFSASPSLLPYVILGIILGRVNTVTSQ